MGYVGKSLRKSLVVNGFASYPQKGALSGCGEDLGGVGKVWTGVRQKTEGEAGAAATLQYA